MCFTDLLCDCNPVHINYIFFIILELYLIHSAHPVKNYRDPSESVHEIRCPSKTNVFFKKSRLSLFSFSLSLCFHMLTAFKDCAECFKPYHTEDILYRQPQMDRKTKENIFKTFAFHELRHSEQHMQVRMTL